MASLTLQNQLSPEKIFREMNGKMNITRPRFYCLSYLIFILNFVIALLGITITVIAIWLIMDPNFFEMNASFDIPDVNSVVYVAIVVGLAMLIIGFLGCWGAFQGNKCMLLSYVIAVVILLIIEVIIAALVLKAVNDPKIQGKVNKFLKEQLQERLEKNQGKSEFMDFIHTKIRCCGVEGPRDFNNYKIPPSCFDEEDEYYKEGCSKKVIQYIKEYATEIGGITLGAFFLQLIVGTIAVCLYCSVRYSSSAEKGSDECSTATKGSAEEKHSDV